MSLREYDIQLTELGRLKVEANYTDTDERSGMVGFYKDGLPVLLVPTREIRYVRITELGGTDAKTATNQG